MIERESQVKDSRIARERNRKLSKYSTNVEYSTNSKVVIAQIAQSITIAQRCVDTVCGRVDTVCGHVDTVCGCVDTRPSIQKTFLVKWDSVSTHSVVVSTHSG
ncbi:hypothetical protein Taro_041309 [Colocasia esculenta]|uniref:Uncharacterized protein n=1 Tax=Colocasia esculenta TaxID=4460 RepID=A0A843WVH5_COLES|nr:hypothetical protein [Colocasia esculenta]